MSELPFGEETMTTCKAFRYNTGMCRTDGRTDGQNSSVSRISVLTRDNNAVTSQQSLEMLHSCVD